MKQKVGRDTSDVMGGEEGEIKFTRSLSRGSWEKYKINKREEERRRLNNKNMARTKK